MPRSRGVVTAVVSILVAAAACEGRNPAPPRADSVVELTINVVAADGTRRDATIGCGKPPSRTGFISKDIHLYAACTTALANDYADEFLLHDTFPAKLKEAGCVPLPDGAEFAGARATFRGTFESEPVDAELHVRTTCEQELWRYLLPLTEPRIEGVVVAGDNVQLSDR